MIVLLIHGLGRTPASLFGLASMLRRAGHHPRFFAYSPTFESLPRVVRRLATCLKKLEGKGQPVGLVGHSLGGLLLRNALVEVPSLRVRNFIMLGTPNRPPRLAWRAWKLFPFRWFTGDCGALLSDPAAMAALPCPTVPYVLIAGTAGPRGRYSPFGIDANDGVVAADEVPIRTGDDVLHFPVWHTLMMDDPEVRRAVLAALS